MDGQSAGKAHFSRVQAAKVTVDVLESRRVCLLVSPAFVVRAIDGEGGRRAGVAAGLVGEAQGTDLMSSYMITYYNFFLFRAKILTN